MKREFELEGTELDRRLESSGQARIREAVRALPEETLSLAWRSELNSKLRASAARRRKLNLFGWIWKPTAGLAVAGALAVAILFHPGISGPSGNGDLEMGLVNHYVESTVAREIAADGVTPNEARDSNDTGANAVDWDQEDVGATL